MEDNFDRKFAEKINEFDPGNARIDEGFAMFQATYAKLGFWHRAKQWFWPSMVLLLVLSNLTTGIFYWQEKNISQDWQKENQGSITEAPALEKVDVLEKPLNADQVNKQLDQPDISPGEEVLTEKVSSKSKNTAGNFSVSSNGFQLATNANSEVQQLQATGIQNSSMDEMKSLLPPGFGMPILRANNKNCLPCIWNKSDSQLNPSKVVMKNRGKKTFAIVPKLGDKLGVQAGLGISLDQIHHRGYNDFSLAPNLGIELILHPNFRLFTGVLYRNLAISGESVSFNQLPIDLVDRVIEKSPGSEYDMKLEGLSFDDTQFNVPLAIRYISPYTTASTNAFRFYLQGGVQLSFTSTQDLQLMLEYETDEDDDEGIEDELYMTFHDRHEGFRYQSISLNLGMGLEGKLSDRWVWQAGANYNYGLRDYRIKNFKLNQWGLKASLIYRFSKGLY